MFKKTSHVFIAKKVSFNQPSLVLLKACISKIEVMKIFG
jgi:hypothetical protein